MQRNEKLLIGYISSINFEFEESLKKVRSLGNYEWVQCDKTKKILDLKDISKFDILAISPDAVERYDDKFFDAATKLKFATTVTAGFEYVDLNSAKRHGVKISNCVGANAQSVAEHVFGMFLNLSKRISEYDRDIRKYGVYKYDGYSGHEMHGKTLGIIGFGNIGQKVADISRGFNMKVLYYNKSKKEYSGATQSSLKNLLSHSDYIAVCIPLNKETKEIINDKNSKFIKKGSYIVSITRDEVIDTKCILKLLDKNVIGGFGLDGTVYTPIDKRFLKYSNVLVNAHNGFNTVEADLRVEQTAIGNIQKFIEGKPINLVN